MKNNKNTILIILCVFLVFEVICFCGYKILSYFVNESELRGFATFAAEHIQGDDEFAAKYGTPVSVELNPDVSIVENTRTDMDISFIVTVESGEKYLVLINYSFDLENDYYTYKEVKQLKGNIRADE